MTKHILGVDLHFVTLEPSVYDGGPEVHGGTPPLDLLVGAMPFRSVVCQRWLVHVGSVWPVIDSDFAAQPAELVGHLLSTFWHGLGILILSDDRACRDKDKAFLRAVVAVAPGWGAMS
jgi:hypothetical protein